MRDRDVRERGFYFIMHEGTVWRVNVRRVEEKAGRVRYVLARIRDDDPRMVGRHLRRTARQLYATAADAERVARNRRLACNVAGLRGARLAVPVTVCDEAPRATAKDFEDVERALARAAAGRGGLDPAVVPLPPALAGAFGDIVETPAPYVARRVAPPRDDIESAIDRGED